MTVSVVAEPGDLRRGAQRPVAGRERRTADEVRMRGSDHRGRQQQDTYYSGKTLASVHHRHLLRLLISS